MKQFLEDNFVRPRRLPADGGRIDYIDLAKGICILLVVMFHVMVISGVEYDMPNLVTLRMPLYFILSGLFFKDYGGFLQLAERKVQKILVPFLFFWFFGDLVMHVLIPLLHHGGVRHREFVEGLFSYNPANVAVWFLLALFIDNLIFALLVQTLRRQWQLALTVAVIGLAGWMMSLRQVLPPLYLAPAMSSLPFFYLGYALRRHTGWLTSLSMGRDIAIGVLLVALSYAMWYFCGTPHIEFLNNLWTGHPLLAIVSSVCITLGVLSLCKCVVWLPVVSYFGRYSIIPLVVHWPLITILRRICTLAGLEGGPLWLMFLLSFLFCWVAIPLCRRWLPHVTAQRDIMPLRRAVSGMLR